LLRLKPVCRRAICLIYLLLLLASGLGFAGSGRAGAQKESAGPGAAAGTASVQGKAASLVQAREAVLIDEGSGRILYALNSSQPVPMASLTKVMTALLVLENGYLDQKVYISSMAAETGESTVSLEPGEILSRRQLLYALLLSSANDAATALAESVAGSEDNFVAMMNRRAQELGLNDTHFSNSHGLNAPDHYSSAYDLAVLSRKAMTDPVFQQIVATKSAVLPWAGNPWPRFLINQNRLLFRYSGAIGIKTGYTRQAGNCVIGEAQRGSLRLIAVVMHSPDVYDDIENLLNYGFNNYQAYDIDGSLQPVSVKVSGGLEPAVDARPERQLMAAVLPGEERELSYKTAVLPAVAAPIKQGAVLGDINIFLDGSQIGAVDLVATSDIPARPGFWARMLGVLRF
jgi:D-alanyl-D-alanine carboxypeptidase (penicillin-binding protein 5/6)